MPLDAPFNLLSPSNRDPVVRLRRLVVLLVLVILAGCGDLDPVPTVEFSAEEPVAALRFGEGLPSLPSLAQRWVPDGSLAPVVDRWHASWDLPGPVGLRTRSEAVGAAAPFLVAGMPAGAMESLLGELDRALRSVEEVVAGTEGGDPLLGPLQEAALAHAGAADAWARGDGERALIEILRASDHLRATTPDALARTLILRAEEILRRISTDETYPEVTRLRGERLVIGARDALGNGDHALALRRAWYAAGLLEGGEVGDGESPSPEAEDAGS